MNLILKSARIIDTNSSHHNATKDILIENGIISKIAKNIENINNYKEIELENLHVSQGWFDSSVCFGEPGFEDRETIQNGLNTAAKSGFTSVCMQANTKPVLNNNSDIFAIKGRSANHAVSLLPVGALTTNSDSLDLAELFDMLQAGAVAFSDYKIPVKNPNLLKIALQYTKQFKAVVCSFPLEQQISGKGVMNEELTSTKTGLKGSPNLAESMQVARDLFLLEYTEGQLHIPTISTKESVELIREAKKKGLNITCSAAIHNLFFTDEMLSDFNTQYKVNPPLRIQTDIDALIEGLKDGTIDMVTSDHNPVTIEDKNIEFENAAYGTIGLETAFGALNTLFTTEKSVELLTKGKAIFNANTHCIEEGQTVDLSLFNPETKYTFAKNNIFSKSKNSIFLNHDLRGNVYGIVANNKHVL
ncbi:dihydroorotase family protein [Aurantibacter sp.]|uniref:dihydroorotase n=1 Tax=Aurantibacter sp. TaxID=2807103 RepID=UPI0035C8383D